MREVCMECVINHTLCLCRLTEERRGEQFHLMHVAHRCRSSSLVLSAALCSSQVVSCGQFVVCHQRCEAHCSTQTQKGKIIINQPELRFDRFSLFPSPFSLLFRLLTFCSYCSFMLLPQREVIQFFPRLDHHQVQVYSEVSYCQRQQK